MKDWRDSTNDREDDLPGWSPSDFIHIYGFILFGKGEGEQRVKPPLGWINWCPLTNGVWELACSSPTVLNSFQVGV